MNNSSWGVSACFIKQCVDRMWSENFEPVQGIRLLCYLHDNKILSFPSFYLTFILTWLDVSDFSSALGPIPSSDNLSSISSWKSGGGEIVACSTISSFVETFSSSSSNEGEGGTGVNEGMGTGEALSSFSGLCLGDSADLTLSSSGLWGSGLFSSAGDFLPP